MGEELLERSRYERGFIKVIGRGLLERSRYEGGL